MAIAGNTAGANIDGIIYMTGVCFFHTSLTFTGQNYGAKKYHRIVRAVLLSTACAAACDIIIGWSGLIFGRELLGIYSTEPEVIEWGMLRLKVMMPLYFLCSTMDSISGALRGLGYSLYPTFVTLFGVCIFRVVWIFWVFPKYKSFACVILNFPITYILIILFCSFGIFYAYRKLMNPKSGYAVSAG